MPVTAMSTPSTGLPKMMIGFVVRRCAVALGHDPSAQEFADWANNYTVDGRVVCVFGRPITITEAQVILRHRGRPVTARSAEPHEAIEPDSDLPVGPRANVTSFAEAAARLRGRQRTG